MAAPSPDASVHVLNSPRAVTAALAPLRQRLLACLAEPDSAVGLSRRLGLPRQKLNYHLRELEAEGLVELVEERPRRGCVERVLRASAGAFVVSPNLLGDLAADPDTTPDRLSSAHLVALAARMIEEVAVIRERASAAGQPMVTLSLDTELSFRSPAAFKAFADEAAHAITEIAARHDAGETTGSRRYRFVVGAHPVLEARRRRTSSKEK